MDRIFTQAPVVYFKQNGYSANICSGGSTCSNMSTPQYAFDGSITGSNAYSNEAWNGLSGVTYLGYDFGSSKAIRQIRYYNYSAQTGNITSVKIQYSDNGTDWTTESTQSVVDTISVWNTLTVSNVGPHRYWRLLVNANQPNSGYSGWLVFEMQMMTFAYSLYCMTPDGSEKTVTIM